jgi:hypothetical protein
MEPANPMTSIATTKTGKALVVKGHGPVNDCHILAENIAQTNNA